MRLSIAALVLAACLPVVSAPEAHAAGPDVVEASMQRSGTVSVDAEGRVTGHELKNAQAYPAGIRELVAQVVPGWRFEPVLEGGQPTAARADMHLRLVARPTADGSLAIALRGASFGQPGGGRLRSRKMPPPEYPRDLMRAYVSGTVYLVLRLAPDGTVVDAFAEQTNLRKSGTRMEMEAWRQALERAALKKARHWTFSWREPADAADRSLRVPIDFVLGGSTGHAAISRPGQWDAYLPGTHRRAPWLNEADYAASTGFDALPNGSVQEIGSGLKLLTPLNAG